MTHIGIDAFYGCTGLTSIVIGNSVTSIGSGAFSGCTGLTSVTIPNSVTSIGSDAFYGCTGLTSIVIGNSVTFIGDNAFCGCTGLTSVTIPNSVTSIGNYAFYGCTGLTSVVIGNSVTSIGNWAFSGCTGLTSVVIGNSVTFIGDNAFCGCTGLMYIECHTILPPLLGTNDDIYYWGCPYSIGPYSVFENIPKTIPLYVPEESISDYQTAEGWNEFLDIQPLASLIIESNNSFELNIYPNPTDDMINIDLFNPQNADIEIFNINGSLIYSKPLKSNQEQIDLSAYPKGLYFVKVRQQGLVKVGKVVLE
jgi:hypothetical protein